MRVQWYDVRYLKCSGCRETSPPWFYLKEIKGWVRQHHDSCGATSFREEGYVEYV